MNGYQLYAKLSFIAALELKDELTEDWEDSLQTALNQCENRYVAGYVESQLEFTSDSQEQIELILEDMPHWDKNFWYKR